MNARTLSRTLCLCGTLTLAGCAVGPDYRRPPMDMPATYRDVILLRYLEDARPAAEAVRFGPCVRFPS